MAFWIATALLAALVALFVGWPLVMTRRSVRSRAAHDAQVFRDQLSEIDRDVERGVLSAAEAEAARIEVSRRLIAASEQSEATPDHAPAPRGASYALAAALLAGAPLAGWGLYAALGAPGLPDQPLSARFDANRAPQEVAELRMPPPGPPPEEAGPIVATIEEIEARFAAEGRDPRGLFVLAQAYAEIGQFGKAWRAYEELRENSDETAPVWILTAQAESMVLAAGGYVSPEAEALLGEALARAPDTPIARYYMGAAHAQTNRPRSAVDIWVGLLRDSPADAPWRAATQAQIEEVVRRANLTMPEIPAPAPGPSEAERLAEMRGLIEQLDARLAEEGGMPEAWAQLVRSWTAIGEPDAAADAEARARATLAEDAEGLAAFEEALAAPVTAQPAAPHDSADPRAAVEALDARLAEEGGGAGAWLRLVASWRGLGEAEKAAEAEARAREALADQPGQLAAFEDALSGAVPEALRGPSREDVEAAAAMSDEDRSSMIRGMVEGLRGRLYDEGGSAQEWGRLINALGVLGDSEAAGEAYARAVDAHGDDPAAAAALRGAAQGAGVTVQ
jgi:cytochrome c-type biogenesis protein CcmH